MLPPPLLKSGGVAKEIDSLRKMIKEKTETVTAQDIFAAGADLTTKNRVWSLVE